MHCSINLNSLLACPICKKRLVDLRCCDCDIVFNARNKIPSFISRPLYQSTSAYEEVLDVIEFWGNGWARRLAEPDHNYLFKSDRHSLEEYCKKTIEKSKISHAIFGVDLEVNSLKDKAALNIGCGCGSEALLLSWGGAAVIAMDITRQAAEAAQKLMPIIGANGIGIQADARFIPLVSSSIDIVFSNGVLHHSSDIKKSVSEIHRILKPGGKAYIMLYATWSISFMQMRLIHSMGETDWETKGLTNPHTTTFTKRECMKLFSQFCNVQIRKTGGNIIRLAKIGKYMPTALDQMLFPYLGDSLYIIAEKF